LAFGIGCDPYYVTTRSVPPLSRDVLKDRIRFAWSELAESKSQCPDYDYFPNGGIQNFYCHLKNFSNLPEVESFFGSPIFLKGPHKEGFLILNSQDEFGYYNPEFPKFLRKYFLPAGKNQTFRDITQPVFDSSVRPLARIMFLTYLKLNSNPVYFTKERIRYRELLESKRLDPFYYEKYYSFLYPNFTDQPDIRIASKFARFQDLNPLDYDGNVVKTAVFFWIRRGIDGTDKEFFAGLGELMEIYDQNFIKSLSLEQPE
jgi:hypothetical protein